MRRKKRKNGYIGVLLTCMVVAAAAVLWWYFVHMGLFRTTMRDAVFIRKIENIMRKGERIETEQNTGSAGI